MTMMMMTTTMAGPDCSLILHHKAELIVVSVSEASLGMCQEGRWLMVHAAYNDQVVKGMSML